MEGKLLSDRSGRTGIVKRADAPPDCMWLAAQAAGLVQHGQQLEQQER
jgi:hypothetical protein